MAPWSKFSWLKFLYGTVAGTLFMGSMLMLKIFIETGRPLALINMIWALVLMVWAIWLGSRWEERD